MSDAEDGIRDVPQGLVGSEMCIRDSHPNGPPRLGVAGGLGPDAGAILAVLRAEADPGSFASLSFDAESGVRSPVPDPTPGEKHQDALDAEKTRAWVRVAADAVTSAAVARSGDA